MIGLVGSYCKAEIKDRWIGLCPAALMVLCDVILYCDFYGVPCVLTETVSSLEEDEKLKRVSSTHRTGRAFDLSLKGWTDVQAESCAEHFAEKYIEVASVSPGGQRKLTVIHDAGTGKHIHFQVHAKYSIQKLV